MNTGLKNALIIIFVLVCLYYFISPYQNCLREESGRESCEDWKEYVSLYKTKDDCVSSLGTAIEIVAIQLLPGRINNKFNGWI
jgi:hypothetical protein